MEKVENPVENIRIYVHFVNSLKKAYKTEGRGASYCQVYRCVKEVLKECFKVGKKRHILQEKRKETFLGIFVLYLNFRFGYNFSSPSENFVTFVRQYGLLT